jgi:hypothetical protein
MTCERPGLFRASGSRRVSKATVRVPVFYAVCRGIREMRQSNTGFIVTLMIPVFFEPTLYLGHVKFVYSSTQLDAGGSKHAAFDDEGKDRYRVRSIAVRRIAAFVALALACLVAAIVPARAAAPTRASWAAGADRICRIESRRIHAAEVPTCAVARWPVIFAIAGRISYFNSD